MEEGSGSGSAPPTLLTHGTGHHRSHDIMTGQQVNWNTTLASIQFVNIVVVFLFDVLRFLQCVYKMMAGCQSLTIHKPILCLLLLQITHVSKYFFSVLNFTITLL